jgi:hypothetical protein
MARTGIASQGGTARPADRPTGAWVRAALGVLALAPLLACHTVGGTNELSRTLGRRATLGSAPSIAVVPPPANGQLPGLSEALGAAVSQALSSEIPGARIVPPDHFKAALGRRRGYLWHFRKWLDGYARTDVLHAEPLPLYGKAAGVEYLLLLRGAEVSKERITAREAKCGFGCRVPDPNDLWRNRLVVVAEVIDLRSGTKVWQGVGEAEAVTAERIQLDFSHDVRFDPSPTEQDPFTSQLVSLSSQGLAREVSGRPVAPKSE